MRTEYQLAFAPALCLSEGFLYRVVRKLRPMITVGKAPCSDHCTTDYIIDLTHADEWLEPRRALRERLQLRLLDAESGSCRTLHHMYLTPKISAVALELAVASVPAAVHPNQRD